MSTPEPASPDTNLVNLILALLTPMFLWCSAGDIPLARVAAAQALNQHSIANRLSLWTVAKIIAFDIATLSSLSQSAYEDISISLALRLRGNAVSLDRSGDRSRRLLNQENRTAATNETGDSVEATIAEAQRMVQQAKARIQAAAVPAPEPQPIAETAAEPVVEGTQAAALEPASTPVARTPAEQPQAWPNAVTAVAEELATDIGAVPPAQRWGEMARIMALTAAAADNATAPPPVPEMAAQ